jgi:hypothetical protein
MRSIIVTTIIGALALAAPASAQPAPDHLACYKAKDRTKGRFTVSLSNAGASQSCVVKMPAKLACLETEKSNVIPTPAGGGPAPTPAGNFLCYQMKCPRPSSFEMQDQFGKRVVGFRGAQLLCAPATRGPASNFPTGTTLPPGPCHFSDGRCEGTCAGGGHCTATAASGECVCRGTPCGDADTPECEGFCTSSGEACVFSIDGCSCVRIP